LTPLSVLVASINDEAGVHDLGRERAHQWLLSRLEQRLRLVDDRGRWPGIAAQAIDRPVFLMGFPRAGTTYLHTLLSVDPATIAPLYWQLTQPSPSPNDPNVNHHGMIERSQKVLEYQGWLRPEIARVHFHAADLPEEDFIAFEYSFVSTGFLGSFDLPTYVQELVAGDFSSAYVWHKRVLQSLQFGTESRRWMLKAPQHTMHLPVLMTEYPDALLVQHHRDPSKVMASLFSLLAAYRSNCTDRSLQFSEREARVFLNMYASAIESSMALRDGQALDHRFLDIHYLELERDPISCVRRVYKHAGLEFTPAIEVAIRAWLEANRKGKHGKHKYLLSEYGLTQDEVHTAFSKYIKRFNVELEPGA
jgi:hypothetical protein